MVAPEGRGKKGKSGRKSFLWVFLLTMLFGAWLLVSSVNSSFNSGIPVTGLNLNYIVTGFHSIIGNAASLLSNAISTMRKSIGSNANNVRLLAAPIAATGMIPLYLLAKKGSGSGGFGFFMSIVYLLYVTLIAPTWFGLAYLAMLPTMALWGFAFYAYGRKVFAYLFLLGTAFVNPLASGIVLAFSIAVFYKSWDEGNQGIPSNLFSISLEGISGFVFIIFFLKYSYRFFIDPSLVYNANQNVLATLGSSHLNVSLTNFFANVMPVVPEFTSQGGLILSLVVIGVFGIIGALSRLALKRVGTPEP